MVTMRQRPTEIRVTAEKCMEYGAAAYGRRADQTTANYNPLGGTSERACANCLFFISPNACTVVEDWPIPISPTGLSQFWTALPAPSMGQPIPVVIVEAAMDGAEKAVWDSAYVTALPNSAFAVVTANGERKLPYKDAAGEIDKPHLRNALARLSQADLSDSERAAAKRKLDAAAREAGVGDDGDDGEKGLLARIVAAVKGVFGSPGETVPEREGGAFRFYKDKASGGWRWVALVSNKWRDHDHPPEIIEDAAHKEFVAWLDAGGDYPEAWLWHTPGTRWGRADFADYTTDGFLVMAGPVDKGMEPVAERLAGQKLGVSHGFYQRYSDKGRGIIGWYRSFEVSALPPEVAANQWTAMSVLQKEVGMAFTAAKRAFLEKTLGAEKVRALEGDIGGLADALKAAGVEYKDLEAASGDVADSMGQPSVLSAKDIGDAVTKALEPLSATVQTLAASVAGVKAATDKLPDMEARLKALERSDDDKIADAFKARTSGVAVAAGGYRASQAGDTVLGDKDGADAALKLAAPIVDPKFMQALRGVG